EPQGQPPTVRRRRMGLAIGFLVVAALAVAASVVFAMRYALSGPIILSASQVSNEIPLGETKQAGDAIGTLLTDMGWLGRPEPERRRQLEEALGRARKLGASTLLLLDRDGNVKAVARWGPGGAQVSFPGSSSFAPTSSLTAPRSSACSSTWPRSRALSPRCTACAAPSAR